MKASTAEKITSFPPALAVGDVVAMGRRAVAEEAALRSALAEADLVPQMMVHAQLTGDESLLQEAAPFIEGGWSHMAHIPQPLREKGSNALVAALKKVAADGMCDAGLSAEKVTRLLSYGVNALVPDDYGLLFMEEAAPVLGRFRTAQWRRDPDPERLANFRVVIAGAGASGLGMAIMLQNASIPFEIIERNEEVGGAWYENQYPGAGVDIPNHVYSFSFEPKLDWNRAFGLKDELLSYLKHISEKYDLRRHIRFNSEVVEAVFHNASARWRIVTRRADGSEEVLTANVFVSSVGTLNRPFIPDIPGLSSFVGPMFHTARWDHSVDVRGKHVAIVGTGASCVQVGPAIAPEVELLLVFQRSPGWVGLNQSYHTVFPPGMKWASEHIPYFYMWCRFLLFWANADVNYPMVQRDPDWDKPHLSLNARSHMVRENLIRHMSNELDGRPDLLAKVIPNYPPWGKRMLRDNHWFKMLRRDNVDLIDSKVARVEADAVVDAEGRRYPVDIIVMGTGFKATEILAPMHIVGRSGRISTMSGRMKARVPILVPSFPSFRTCS